jgi:hypothetical protein
MGNRKKKKPQSDPTIDAYIRLGGGVPEGELDQMTPGERIMAAGNQWAREQLQPARPLRPSIFAENPFRRDR